MTDIAVIGAGIAGLGAGALLARDNAVTVFEAETTPAQHATGRSAALFIPSYGPSQVRALSAATRPWLAAAGDGWSEMAMMAPRPLMYVTDGGHQADLEHIVDQTEGAGHGRLERIDPVAARALCPALAPSWLAGAAVDRNAHDLDVAAIVDTYRRMLGAEGGALEAGTRVRRVERLSSGWQLHHDRGTHRADLVVNAAGAWVDQIARHAGLEPLGFEPRRRTLALAVVPPGIDPGPAMVASANETFYFGREAGGLLFSPADATASEPCDAKADEVDVARAIDRINEATLLGIRSVRSAWAGLRTFGPDGGLVIGPDPRDPTFVWCAGQGGYGIQTCHGAALATAALARGDALPAELTDEGLTALDLLPDRLMAPG